MRAGLYVRISRDYAGQGLGVARQEEDCRKHATALGWEVAEVYVDNDVSATSKKRRPSYDRMLEALKAGDIGAIVAWHPDRLYRKIPDLTTLIETVKQTHAEISTVNGGAVDLNTPTGRLIAGLLGQVATYEGEHKSERWSRSWRQGRELGAPVTNSRRLFGYGRDGATVIESEAEAANLMATELLAGTSLEAVTRLLHNKGITTTGGNVWTHQGIKRYLENPRVAGYSTHKGEILGDGQWPPIIERERWEEVRALLGSRTRPYAPRVALLNGLVHCGKCGGRMITSGSTSSAKGGTTVKKRYYRCSSRPAHGGCGGTLILAIPVEEIVEAFAQEKLTDPAVVLRVEALRDEPTGAQNALGALEMHVVELEHQLAEPGVSVDMIMRAIARTKEKQEHLLDSLAAKPRVPLPVQGGPWPEDLRRRRALVDLVVKRVEIQPRVRPTNKFDEERVVILER